MNHLKMNHGVLEISNFLLLNVSKDVQDVQDQPNQIVQHVLKVLILSMVNAKKEVIISIYILVKWMTANRFFFDDANDF